MHAKIHSLIESLARLVESLDKTEGESYEALEKSILRILQYLGADSLVRDVAEGRISAREAAIRLLRRYRLAE